TEGSGLTPDGSVQFQDGATALGGPLTCVDQGNNTCSAQLTTSSLTGGPHSITAAYLGGTNHDPSTSNTVSQVIKLCTANPVATTNADGGAGSLRQAIADACGTAGNNVITFDMGSVVSPITLTTAELTPVRNVVINGPGAKTLSIARDASAPAFRIF